MKSHLVLLLGVREKRTKSTNAKSKSDEMLTFERIDEFERQREIAAAVSLT